MLAGKSASAYNVLSAATAFLPPLPPCKESPALIDDQLLDMLRCPQDQSSLARAEQQLVKRTNRAIAARRVFNLAGQRIEKTIDGGLIRQSGDLMYPVVDGIPVMLPDEAIALSQLADFPPLD